jgi:late competence protein required for DNA uptake (superfamily II DNA/RNA helicase)
MLFETDFLSAMVIALSPLNTFVCLFKRRKLIQQHIRVGSTTEQATGRCFFFRDRKGISSETT